VTPGLVQWIADGADRASRVSGGEHLPPDQVTGMLKTGQAHFVFKRLKSKLELSYMPVEPNHKTNNRPRFRVEPQVTRTALPGIEARVSYLGLKRLARTTGMSSSKYMKQRYSTL
jgi:hypothetical protein